MPSIDSVLNARRVVLEVLSTTAFSTELDEFKRTARHPSFGDPESIERVEEYRETAYALAERWGLRQDWLVDHILAVAQGSESESVGAGALHSAGMVAVRFEFFHGLAAGSRAFGPPFEDPNLDFDEFTVRRFPVWPESRLTEARSEVLEAFTLFWDSQVEPLLALHPNYGERSKAFPNVRRDACLLVSHSILSLDRERVEHGDLTQEVLADASARFGIQGLDKLDLEAAERAIRRLRKRLAG